jgi:hypothetical protein
MDLRIARGCNSFFDVRDGVRIDLGCQIEKAFCTLQVAPDLYYALELVLFQTAENHAVLQGFILRTVLVALLKEPIVNRERHLDIDVHGPKLVRPAQTFKR